MRRVLALLLVLACGGCTRLENPIIAADGPSLDPALLGTWELTVDDATARVDIRADGDAGSVTLYMNDPDEEPKVERYRIVTAQLERRGYASLQSIGADGEPEGTWFYYPYELPRADLLIIHHSNDDAWKEAVKNKTVAGRIEKTQSGESVTVTAGGAELRAFVLGYGSVTFSDDVLAELRRAR